jgi:predicted permease
LLHSFANVMRADRGYQVERVLAVDLSLFGQRYSEADSRIGFYRSATENVRALPGVLAAGAISNLPVVFGSIGASQTIFYPEDTDFQKVVLARPVAMIRSVTSGYFAASGTPLRAGRFFTEQEQSLVAVVSESLARSLWPGEPPEGAVGRSLKQGDVRRPLIEVVGVVADVLPGAADHPLPPFIYRPHGQWASGPMTLVVRTDREPASLAAPVRAEIRKMDSNLPIPAVRTMREIVSTSVAQRRFQMLLISFFALAAMMLGAVGVYGVVNYSVACRTREAGVRLALGAVKSDILRWIFSQGMRPALYGLVAGMAGAIGIAQALRSLLFRVEPTDPAALGGVALILLCTSAVACYLPARRASRLDPLAALRQE